MIIPNFKIRKLIDTIIFITASSIPMLTLASQVNLNWTANPLNENVTSYNILRSTNNCNSLNKIGTSLLPSFSDTTAATSTAYCYIIQAVNSVGVSPNSNPFNITTPAGQPAIDTTPPSAPPNLTSNYVAAITTETDQIASLKAELASLLYNLGQLIKKLFNK